MSHLLPVIPVEPSTPAELVLLTEFLKEVPITSTHIAVWRKIRFLLKCFATCDMDGHQRCQTKL